MPFNFKNYIEGVGDSLFNSPTTPNKLGAFGGEANQFAADLDKLQSQWYKIGEKGYDLAVPVGMKSLIPRAIFNDYALFNFRGMYGDLFGSGPYGYYFDGVSKANELMGGDRAKNISVSKLIEFYSEVYPKIRYKPADFLYGKYYKKIPINQLITLRRFPIPIEDNIFDLNLRSSKDDQPVDATQVAGSTAITYLGETAGNKLEDILNFSFGLNWKELQSEMQTIESGGGYTSQPFYSALGNVGGFTSGKGIAKKALGGIGQAGADGLKGVTAAQKFRAGENTVADRIGTTYANFVDGPINVIDKTTIRDRGFNFSNDIKLTFEYELKSLNYVNPKIAMLDLINNMLIMSANNGQFWGGGHRYYGSAGYVSSTFGDLSKLKSGDFAGYATSVGNDITSGFKSLFGDGSGGFSTKSVLEGALDIGKNILGSAAGGLLKSVFGSYQGQQGQKAFISGEPTGNWHVTVGNPLNPIVMMGNMVLNNTSMVFSNELGWDDFPMEVKFEMDLKHGKPRDRDDIANMFNAGRGRIYASSESSGDIINKIDNAATYGAIPPSGKQGFSATQSDNAPKGGNYSNSFISQVNAAGAGLNASLIQTNNTAVSSAEYINNIKSLMIDS